MGQGSLTSGYFGGMLDAATGLIYVGGGQYYDPATGRFLTRGMNPDQSNPYVPWRGNPVGVMFVPLALLGMVYGGKKKRGKWDQWVILLVLCGAVGMSLSACNPGSIEIDVTSQVETPSATVEVTQGATVIASMPIPTSTATSIPTGTCYFMTTHPLKTIFFGGSNGANLANIGPDPSIQTPVWTAIADEVFPYIGPNKAAQANSVNIESYKDDNLRVIGYSAGGDAALMFADKYRKYQLENNREGKITGVVVLGGTFSGTMTDGSNLATEWNATLDNLLLWGTNVYILDDRGCGGGEANSYSPPSGSAGVFHFENRTISGNDCSDEAKRNDSTGQEHWDGGLSGQVGVGTNNNDIFRDEVLNWFTQLCE